MITLKTITTIELSSVCNLACEYCVNRMIAKHPNRKQGIMSDHIFERSLFWLQKLCDLGMQKEVHLNGNGESFLDPQLVERARKVKEIMGSRYVGLCTNAINFTQEIAYKLKDLDVNVDFSVHSPAHVRKAIKMHKKAELNGVVNPGAIVMSHNGAGQLEPENCVDIEFFVKCDPLIEGRGYISSEGFVSPCCYDYQLLGAFGHVADLDLIDRPILDYKLCKDCHQAIPPDVKKEIDEGVWKHGKDIVTVFKEMVHDDRRLQEVRDA